MKPLRRQFVGNQDRVNQCGSTKLISLLLDLISYVCMFVRQVVHIVLPLSPSSIIWYQRKLGSKQAYRVVHQPVSRGLAVFADAWLWVGLRRSAPTYGKGQRIRGGASRRCAIQIHDFTLHESDSWPAAFNCTQFSVTVISVFSPYYRDTVWFIKASTMLSQQTTSSDSSSIRPRCWWAEVLAVKL